MNPSGFHLPKIIKRIFKLPTFYGFGGGGGCKCEFFNAPGMHPVYDKPLKPVSQYIVNKYVMSDVDSSAEQLLKSK